MWWCKHLRRSVSLVKGLYLRTASKTMETGMGVVTNSFTYRYSPSLHLIINEKRILLCGFFHSRSL